MKHSVFSIQEENMDYKKVANEIITNIGGVENIKEVKTCSTRIKIKFISSGKVRFYELGTMEEIKGMFENNGYLHLIVGATNPLKILSYMEEAGVPALLKTEEEHTEADVSKETIDDSEFIKDMLTLRNDLKNIFGILKKYL